MRVQNDVCTCVLALLFCQALVSLDQTPPEQLRPEFRQGVASLLQMIFAKVWTHTVRHAGRTPIVAVVGPEALCIHVLQCCLSSASTLSEHTAWGRLLSVIQHMVGLNWLVTACHAQSMEGLVILSARRPPAGPAALLWLPGGDERAAASWAHLRLRGCHQRWRRANHRHSMAGDCTLTLSA